MSKFTKGPLKVFQDHPDTSDIYYIRPQQGYFGYEGGCELASMYPCRDEKQIAYAYLFSAAPEMYEAIEKTLLALDGLIKIDTKNELKEARILMIEALAKARGGE